MKAISVRYLVKVSSLSEKKNENQETAWLSHSYNQHWSAQHLTFFFIYCFSTRRLQDLAARMVLVCCRHLLLPVWVLVLVVSRKREAWMVPGRKIAVVGFARRCYHSRQSHNWEQDARKHLVSYCKCLQKGIKAKKREEHNKQQYRTTTVTKINKIKQY